MYLSLGVKEKRKDFFNFEKELGDLVRELRSIETRMVVIKGVRRTGKSSLLRVGLAECGLPHLLLDIREFESLTPERVHELVTDSLSRMAKKFPTLKTIVREAIKIPLRHAGVGSGFQATIAGTLEKLNELGKEKGKPIVLAIDEAQKLRQIRGFESFLAYCYDHLLGIKLVLTGSEVGILDRLLGEDAPDAPLFGRPYYEVAQGRLDLEKADRFLKLGLKQLKTRVSDQEISEAVGIFDGVIGWLTSYGYYRSKLDRRRAINLTLRRGSKLVRREIESFLGQRGQARTRYLLIMRMLATPLRWSDIKRGVIAKTGVTVSNKQLSRYLAELVDYGFAVRSGNLYELADPLVKHAIR